MKKGFYAALATLATVAATIIATSACFLFWYQPTEPKSLREE